MISYSLKEIIAIIDGQVTDPNNAIDQSIRFLSFDSRTILSGKETLFFALKSDRNDGHRFIEDAIALEVNSFVVEDLPAKTPSNTNVQFIVVKDSRRFVLLTINRSAEGSFTDQQKNLGLLVNTALLIA